MGPWPLLKSHWKRYYRTIVRRCLRKFAPGKDNPDIVTTAVVECLPARAQRLSFGFLVRRGRHRLALYTSHFSDAVSAVASAASPLTGSAPATSNPLRPPLRARANPCGDNGWVYGLV